MNQFFQGQRKNKKCKQIILEKKFQAEPENDQFLLFFWFKMMSPF